ncbi:hypothetical protein GO730_05860 [Spirosoma sp. HMF3257]|uniref:Uncharacterized protein n=1 Tax=Spirosoma telluris TaxID=2183553 RepID=A0A327NFC7_9BACT|nr:hypothetical protein [Spirosoma telluris]RAI74001.1 hypothetical protein HMF3257_05815 [Spirosoma telluris]
MAQVKQTVATFMASFFGKSEKVISEKLSTDEHNDFTSEVLGLNQKLEELQGEKTTLENSLKVQQDLVTEKATKITELEGKITGLESQVTTLQGQKVAAETEGGKYKAWFEKQAGAGAQLPEADASNAEGAPELSSYNANALAVFRRSR